MFVSSAISLALLASAAPALANVLIARDEFALPKRQEGTIPALLVSYKHHARSLAVRQAGQCDAGYFECSSGDGCCPVGYVCGTFGGQEGCCPIGKSCTGIAGCPAASDVECSDGGCCSAGTSCCTDDSGSPKCCNGSSSGGTTGGSSGGTTSKFTTPISTPTDTGFDFTTPTTSRSTTRSSSPGTTGLSSGGDDGDDNGFGGSGGGALSVQAAGSLVMMAIGAFVVLLL